MNINTFVLAISVAIINQARLDNDVWYVVRNGIDNLESKFGPRSHNDCCQSVFYCDTESNDDDSLCINDTKCF